MGLHLSVPETQISERAAREHRTRIWWTAYTLERLLAAKMGHPVSVQDSDISVDLPSSFGLSEVELADFHDEDYINASIRLARLSQSIISSIYSRRASQTAFSHRVQAALKDLRNWVEALPKHLQLVPTNRLQALERPQKWLHLSFNQVSYLLLSSHLSLIIT